MPETIELAKAIVLDLWNDKVKVVEVSTRQKVQNIDKLQKQIDSFLERIPSASSGKVIAAYERKVDDLEGKKALLEEDIATTDAGNFDFETALDLVLEYLKNPLAVWQERVFVKQQRVLRMVFSKPLAYHRERGFETRGFSVSYAIFSRKYENEAQVVDIA